MASSSQGSIGLSVDRVRAEITAAFVAIWMAFGVFVVPAQSVAAEANEIVAVTSTGRHVFTIEWARTPPEREKGLMGRESMAADHGMLFDFGAEQSVDFWMKNTPLSLDMVFIDGDGKVRRIEARTKPFSLDIIPGGAPVRYVLEVVGGESERIGLAPGDTIEIPGR